MFCPVFVTGIPLALCPPVCLIAPKFFGAMVVVAKWVAVTDNAIGKRFAAVVTDVRHIQFNPLCSSIGTSSTPPVICAVPQWIQVASWSSTNMVPSGISSSLSCRHFSHSQYMVTVSLLPVFGLNWRGSGNSPLPGFSA